MPCSSPARCCKEDTDMNVMGIIFANDATLGDLTNKRTMASLPFGGR